MEPENAEDSQKRYVATVKLLKPLGYTPMGRWRFAKNGLVYDLSAADLYQIERIEREGRCVAGPTKTPDEIAELKRQWDADPCWDLEDTGGFEAYYDELSQYRIDTQARWAQKRSDRLHCLAERLGCPGNIGLAEYVDGLERRLARLESLIGDGEDQP